jgi:putative aldouronate transport system substrate-binding protein
MRTSWRSIARAIAIAVLVAACAAQGFAGAQKELGSASAGAPTEIKALLPTWEPVPDMTNAWWTNFFKETNTKWSIEWVPASDIATKFDLVLSSGNLPDVMFYDPPSAPALVAAIKQGAFWDLTPVLGDFSKYPNLKNNPTPNAWNYVKVDGKIWGVPRSRPQIDLAVKVRKDWVDKFGMPWIKTTDDFYRYLKKVVENDPDGNGKKDTEGFVHPLFCADHLFSAGWGGLDVQKDADGGFVYWQLNDAYTQMITEYMRKLYAEGLMPKEWFALKEQQFEEIFYSGKGGAFSYNIWRDYHYQTKIIAAGQPGAVVESIIDFDGPKAKAAWLAKGVYAALYINKKVPEAKMKKIVAYFEQTCSPDWLTKGYFGWEKTHFEVKDGVKVMNDAGKKEVGMSIQQPLPMMRNDWAKVLMPAAPKAYNDAKLAWAKPLEKIGKIQVFEVLASNSWTQNWPKYSKEWDQKRTEVICGKISVEDYKKYVAMLRDKPEFKAAFKEFAVDYAGKFGK